MAKGPRETPPAAEEEELIAVELGDTVQVKQALDDEIRTTLNITLGCDDTVDNVKMFVMIVACAFACVAQFAPIPFPESRWILGACCGAYFACSGLLTLLMMFWEKDLIYVSDPLSDGWPVATVLQCHTVLPRFESDYKITLQLIDSKSRAVREEHSVTWCIGQFFTKDGFFWEDGFDARIEKELKEFKGKCGGGKKVN